VALRPALEELSRAEGVRAVLLFGSRARGEAQVDSDLDLVVIAAEPRLTPRQRLDDWRRFRALLGDLPVGLDLIVTGWADAERMAQSRWHVMGDVAREGLALHVAG
jgi:predicted nucleotidyltransferase